jgi:ethanolaminephosphotransferase
MPIYPTYFTGMLSFSLVLRIAHRSLRSPIIQSTPKRTAIFVYLTLAISFFAYARFCFLVIKEITEYLGIACFTVRKKDAEGIWRDVRDIQQDGFSKHS